MKLLKLLLFTLLFLAPQIISAQNNEMTFTAPTKRTDATNIVGTLSYKLYRAPTQAGVIASTVPVAVIPNAGTYTDTTAPTGPSWYSIVATETETIVGQGTRTIDSDKTIPLCIGPGCPAPGQGAPALVTKETTVYYTIQQQDKFVFLPVGSVALNISCIADQYINGYYGVARTQVTWFGNVRPLIVVAKCG